MLLAGWPAWIALPAAAGTLDTIGVVLLRTLTTNLNGSGLRVAQVEGSVSSDPQSPAFEANPTNASILRPPGLFTFFSNLGSSSTFPNGVGFESYHANIVGAHFYGSPDGVATNVSHVDNHEFSYFFNTYIAPSIPPSPNARVVNQSFAMLISDVPTQEGYDSAYDDAAARHKTLFVSGVGNGGTIGTPATCYNGIGVAAYGTVSSSVGPTLDNGRCKPDITSISLPPLATSYTTPTVAGSAALLLQAGLRGDGGSDTNSAADMRTLKALLLNGAVKPAGWTNAPTSPLDARHGSGVLNVFNSYMQLAGGKRSSIEQTTVSPGAAHPPGNATGNVSSRRGWDYTTISSASNSDTIKHYYFNLTNAVGDSPFVATATLVWNRQTNRSAINDLNLYLYDAVTDALVAQSVSTVDNVEHLSINALPPGRYDLQILKRGGGTPGSPPRVTNAEDYAVAWQFFNGVSLEITLVSETSVALTWPVYPAGLTPEYTSSLAGGTWSDVAGTAVVTNGMNRLEMALTGGSLYFRLAPP